MIWWISIGLVAGFALFGWLTYKEHNSTEDDL